LPLYSSEGSKEILEKLLFRSLNEERLALMGQLDSETIINLSENKEQVPALDEMNKPQ